MLGGVCVCGDWFPPVKSLADKFLVFTHCLFVGLLAGEDWFQRVLAFFGVGGVAVPGLAWALQHANKVAKTNAEKAQLFAESVERHFGIESDHSDSNHFSEVNKFIKDNYQYFYPPEDPDDYRFDAGNEDELVADVDAQTLIELVKFLKPGFH